uniref:NADH-ubiquinone oxidoreductase chain 2 n=1 Tax=Glycera tesselata TaxID=529286 RepID=A0A0S3CQY4_9ANNE|nr:NADH dehydrogenase subunit 2 [Glycera tesselata]
MKHMPYYILFSITLLMGTLMSLSSNHWIYIWMGFETNLMSFIPIILQSSNNQETEAAIKYFLIQALGSSMILLSSMSILVYKYSMFSFNSMLYLLIFSLMTKMGAAPFHFWLPQIMMSVSWITCMLLATWQKIAPIFIILSISSLYMNKLFMIMAVLGTITGALGGLNQTHLRPLLAYSSIAHLGWMIASCSISSFSTILYFLIYSFMTLPIMLLMFMVSSKSNYISSISNMSIPIVLSLMILFLSLAGLPPLLGFLPKWNMIKVMVSQNMLLYITIMIISSLISLFYYLSIFFNLFLNQSKTMLYNKNTNTSSMINMSLISTMTLGMAPLIF